MPTLDHRRRIALLADLVFLAVLGLVAPSSTPVFTVADTGAATAKRGLIMIPTIITTTTVIFTPVAR